MRNELLYDKSSLLIAITLLVMMAGCLYAGYRLGQRSSIKQCERCKEQIVTVQSSLLGLLALMLGFAFSIALDRFNTRSEAVIQEANAIGTAYLRVTLLPENSQAKTQEQFQRYLHLRLEESALSLTDQERRNRLLTTSGSLQQDLWNQAIMQAKQDPNPVTSGLYLQALNDMFDAYSNRLAELERHIPELVLLMLYAAFLVCAGIIGYSSGLSDNRPSKAVYLMMVVVALLMYLVIDLDRPRRGLIEVSQYPMQSLANSMTTPLKSLP